MVTSSIDFIHPYQYGRLTSQDSIRLIRIAPELVHSQHIGCIISEHANTHNNAASVEYRALSYLWGDPAPSRKIGLLNGNDPGGKWHIHRIHSNLWLFLAHMWRKEQFECLLWTDCLCLNQEDKEEMDQQIPRMGLIYTQAERAIIWLGLSAWQEQHLQEHRNWVKTGAERNRLVSLREHPPQRRLAVFSVLDHDYWRRMWITQEVAMAQKVVVEMQDIPSFDLREMNKTTIGLRFSDGGPHLMELFHLRGSEGTTPLAPRSSYLLLRDHCHRRCTRPQDRIYGLLGMVKEDDPMRQIKIDYEKPASDVLFDALFTVSNPSLDESQNLWAIKALMNIGLLENVNSLEEYSNRDQSWKLTENEVVKMFAIISLRVFDALNLIMATSGGISMSYESGKAVEELVKQVTSLDPPGVNSFQWKAIIGVILALGDQDFFKRTHEQWKDIRWPNLKSQPMWLCANHTGPRPLPRPLSPRPLHVAVRLPLTVSEFRRNDIVKTCANHGQHGFPCDRSKMSFDVPKSGTRLELDYTTPRDWKVVLNVWFQRGASENCLEGDVEF